MPIPVANRATAAAMRADELTQYAMRISGVLGVGQTPLQQDTDDAEQALSLMVQQWQRLRWLAFRLESFGVRVTPFKGIYTIGWGGDFDVPRPGAIESAFLRQTAGTTPDSFPIDFPLRKINSKEEWNAIPLKGLGSWPARWFYDPTIPLGTFYIWPVPIQHFFELHFSASQPIGMLPHDQEVTHVLPPEAQEALVYNLAVKLRENYGMPERAGLLRQATSTLKTLRSLNFAMRPLRMPPALRQPVRWKNPMAGFYPETAAGVPFPVLA